MTCGAYTLVQQQPDRCKYVRSKCRGWDCGTCGPKRAAELKRRAVQGNPNRFITLTTRAGAFPTPSLAAQALRLAWTRCRQEIARRHGKGAAQCLMVFEKTKEGWPHLHILYRGPWISQRWLSRYMGRRLDSPVVDIRKVKSKKRSARYLAKYIAKDSEHFRGCKRTWRTHHYNAKEAPKPKPLYPWRFALARIEAFAFREGVVPSPHCTLGDDVLVVFHEPQPPP